MIEYDLTLASSGAVKAEGYEALLRFGYSRNRGVYRLRVTLTGEWQGLNVRAFWHTPGGDPPSSLVEDGAVEVPALVTALPGEGSITFEGSDGTRTLTSADVRYRVAANSGTEDGQMPMPETPSWQQFVEQVERAGAESRDAARTAAASAEQSLQALRDGIASGDFKGETGPKGDPGPQGVPGKDVEVDAALAVSGRAADAKAVGDALKEKLDKTGGEMSGNLDFKQTSTGLKWTCANGDVYCLRPWSPNNVFQLTRQNPGEGLAEYGVLNIGEDGGVDICGSHVSFMVSGLRRSLLDWMHPVGSIYQSTDADSPAEIFGGSWEQIAQNRVLMGASSTHAAGTTAEAGLPNIFGVMHFWGDRDGVQGCGEGLANTGPLQCDINSKSEHVPAVGEAGIGNTYSRVYLNASWSSSVYGASDTVQPPAYYVYTWRRVA